VNLHSPTENAGEAHWSNHIIRLAACREATETPDQGAKGVPPVP